MSAVGPVPFHTAVKIAHLLRETEFDIGTGHCQEAVRKVFLVDSNGTNTAADDARASKHLTRATDPTKAPHFSLLRWVGGSRGAGHVALSLSGFPMGAEHCLTPGSPAHPGLWKVIPVRNITVKWGLTFYGFDKQIDGVQLS